MAFKIEQLLECVLDAGEGGAQFVAETAHDRDDCNRDAGGNQAYSMAVAPDSFLKKRTNCDIEELPH